MHDARSLGFIVGTQTAAASLALALLCPPEALADIVHTVPPLPITATAVVPDDIHSGDWDEAELDIDNDGVAEFTIEAYAGFGYYALVIRTAREGVYFYGFKDDLEQLPAGTLIGPPVPFYQDGSHAFKHYSGWTGGSGFWEFGDPPAFFGFLFDIEGQSHFGWARAQITQITSTPPPAATYSVTVFEYAYETMPGVPIHAGQVGYCLGDLDGDAAVSGSDLGIMLSQWGSAGIADLDGDGVVGGGDLGILIAAWGVCAD